MRGNFFLKPFLVISILVFRVFPFPVSTVEAPDGEFELNRVGFETISIYEQLYQSANANLPAFNVFALTMKGFNNMKNGQVSIKKEIITIIDFRLSSNEKRLWTIDLQKQKILFHELVAHGMNTGNEYARKFSNTPHTNMSSLGFYVTGGTYHGKHGLSLFLNGVDQGFNHHARKRAIVMHGANYVSEAFIEKYGRLGRSFGCPAVSMDVCQQIIPTIAEGSCLFIYYPDKEFLQKSVVLNNIVE